MWNSAPVNFGQGGDPDQQWNQESSRFTATGFCHADDVTVLQANRNGLPLNRSRFLELKTSTLEVCKSNKRRNKRRREDLKGKSSPCSHICQ